MMKLKAVIFVSRSPKSPQSECLTNDLTCAQFCVVLFNPRIPLVWHSPFGVATFCQIIGDHIRLQYWRAIPQLLTQQLHIFATTIRNFRTFQIVQLSDLDLGSDLHVWSDQQLGSDLEKWSDKGFKHDLISYLHLWSDLPLWLKIELWTNLDL